MENYNAKNDKIYNNKFREQIDPYNNVKSCVEMQIQDIKPRFSQVISEDGVHFKKMQPYIKITEQPASRALRFRYECEGRSAGSIPGVHSTPKNKTYPTIEIVGFKGRAKIVVSCVTKDFPYRPHPHNLIGKDDCKKGVCTKEVNSETMRAEFTNLGIQCVRKKDIEAALKVREELRLDPFKTGFAHRSQPSSIDLNSVRLCFQVFIESKQNGKFIQSLSPVVTEPIFDKKSISNLIIYRLSSYTSSVLGNDTIILLCEKIAKDDIQIRFYEEKCGQVIWEALGDFQSADVHKQVAITFKTPQYHSTNVADSAKVFVQLKRPSDGMTSEPLPFEYISLNSCDVMYSTRKRHKMSNYTNGIDNYCNSLLNSQNPRNWNPSECHLSKVLPSNNYHDRNHLTMKSTDLTQRASRSSAIAETSVAIGENCLNNPQEHKNNSVRASKHYNTSQYNNLQNFQINPNTNGPHAMQNILTAIKNMEDLNEVQMKDNLPRSTSIAASSFNSQYNRNMEQIINVNMGNNNSPHDYGLDSLLNIDSTELVHMNSKDQEQLQLTTEDLQISSLSIR